MISRLSMLAVAGVAATSAFGAVAQAQPTLSHTCEFKAGPRQGQIIDYSTTPGAVGVPVGNRCADMQGSSGVAITQWSRRAESQGRFYSSPGAPLAWSSTGNLRPGFSQTCRFTSGPRSGTTLDYSHTLGAQPVAIGSPCADGASSGVAVAQGS